MFNYFDNFFFGLDCKKKNPYIKKNWNALNIFYRLIDLILGRFEYTLDENTDARYLEMCMLFNNWAAFAKTDGKVGNFAVSGASFFNRYGYPTKYNLHDYMGHQYGTFIPDLPGNEGFADSVLMYNSKCNIPPIIRVRWYAERLTEIQTSIGAAITNLKASIVIQCSKEQQNAVKKAWEAAGDGVPFILYFGELEGAYQDKPLVQSFQQTADSLMTLQEAYDKTFAAFLEEFGINSSAVINKLSGVSKTELSQNNQSISIKLNEELKTRQDALDRCNKLFGTNYSVKLAFKNECEEKENEIKDEEDKADDDI